MLPLAESDLIRSYAYIMIRKINIPKNQVKLIYWDLGNKFTYGSFSIRREMEF